MEQLKYYEVYEYQGNLIDGHDIRQFIDWTSESPRYAKVAYNKNKCIDKFITFKDSELTPILETEY